MRLFEHTQTTSSLLTFIRLTHRYSFFFFLNDPPPPEISPLPLPHALPIWALRSRSPLIPEAGVHFFPRLFRPLFTPAVVVAALGGLIVSDVWLVRAGQLNTALGYEQGDRKSTRLNSSH